MVKFDRSKSVPSRGRSNNKRFSRGPRTQRPPFRKSKVTCDSCSEKCEVPFKPTSNKPVYCDKCFGKKGNTRAPKIAENDLDIINEKLNKIMKALDIE